MDFTCHMVLLLIKIYVGNTTHLLYFPQFFFVTSSSVSSRSSSVTSPPAGFNLFLYSSAHYSCINAVECVAQMNTTYTADVHASRPATLDVMMISGPAHLCCWGLKALATCIRAFGLTNTGRLMERADRWIDDYPSGANAK